jgi:hypothetical protein
MLLVAASETSPELGQRRDALAELGWVDGRTIEIVARFADGDFDLVPGLITERWLSNPTCSSRTPEWQRGLLRRLREPSP